MKPRLQFLSALALSAALVVPSISLAQTTSSTTPSTAPQAESVDPLKGVWFTTNFPELTVKPGETGSISLQLKNEGLPPQRFSLELKGVPEGWEAILKGSGREVSSAMVIPNASQSITLEVTPSADAPPDSTETVEVIATSGGQSYSLPIDVRLTEAEVVADGLSLSTELPALRGTARSTFSFKVQVKNEGPEEGLFNFSASAPQGFQTRFKRGYGSEEITGLPIAAGATETITLDVIPSRAVSTGKYKVGFTAAGEGLSASTELDIEVSGEPAITIVGPGERLSGEAVAGEETSFKFTLANTGSAAATDLEMSGTAPTGWKIEFDTEELPPIAPNGLADVTAKITPSAQAVAGDYIVNVRTSGETVSEAVQFRVTVKTSSLWGAIGLGVIAVAVLVLVAAIMRYGRR